MVASLRGPMLATLFGLTSLVVLPACQTEPLPPKVNQGLAYVQAEVSIARSAVTAATASLKKVRDASAADLPAAVAACHAAVTGLGEKAGGVGLVLGAPQSRADAYFANWQKEIGAVSNEETRGQSADRKAKVMARYSDVQTRIEQLRASFKPFMTRLQEVDTALAANASAGQKAASASIQAALAQESAVLSDIDALDKAVAKLRGK